jgi:hypothetical protein
MVSVPLFGGGGVLAIQNDHRVSERRRRRVASDLRGSAGDMIEAKCELERRFQALGIFGYTIETIVAATNREADRFNLPAGCVQLLGY